MPTELLSPGTFVTMKQNVVYAVPAKSCKLSYTDAGTPTLQTSNLFNFSDFVVPTLGDGFWNVQGMYARCTSGDIYVYVTRDD